MRCASDTGCDLCHIPGIDHADMKHIGVKGVKVSAEVIPVTNELLAFLLKKEDMQARDFWRSQRRSQYDEEDMVGKEAWGHALFEVSRGVLDPYHFELAFGPPQLLAPAQVLSA